MARASPTAAPRAGAAAGPAAGTGGGRGGDGRERRGGHAAPRLASSGVGVASAPPSARWPVSERNTSSRLGSRTVSPAGPRPAASRRPQHLDQGRGAVVDRHLQARCRTASPRRSSTASTPAARAASAGSARVISMTVPPRSGLSSAGVPSAMTSPRSMTAMRSASRSASSRYWVVSSSGGALGHQLLDDLPQVAAAGGVEPGGGLVEEEDGRPVDEGGGEVEPAPHAAGVGRGGPVGRLGQPEAVEQLVGPGADGRPGQVGEPADEAEVLAAGEVLVHGGVLAGEADALAHRLRVGGDVEAQHLGPAGVRPEDGGEDADGRGLAGAVGAEQAEHGAGGDGEIDAGEGADVAEASWSAPRPGWPAGRRGTWPGMPCASCWTKYLI